VLSLIFAQIYNSFLFLSLLFTLLLAVIGFLEIGGAIFSKMPFHDAPISTPELLPKVLKGVEFLFLAPVPTMVIMSLGRYLLVLGGRIRRQVPGSDTRPLARRREDLAPSGLDTESQQVADVKGFVIGLMIAVIATDMVEQVLSRPISHESGSAVSLDWVGLLTESAMILTLGLYVFVLHVAQHAESGRGAS
jgi:hypothetical protein